MCFKMTIIGTGHSLMTDHLTSSSPTPFVITHNFFLHMYLNIKFFISDFFQVLTERSLSVPQEMSWSNAVFCFQMLPRWLQDFHRSLHYRTSRAAIPDWIICLQVGHDFLNVNFKNKYTWVVKCRYREKIPSIITKNNYKYHRAADIF